MELTNKSVIKALLGKYNARPEKHFGQHFILSKNALSKMVDAADIKKSDLILEIGPGIGTLTQELAKNPVCRQAGGTKIMAVEKDPAMAEILKETLIDCKNVKIIQADARIIKIPNPYKIVANLPYNVATFLVHSWLEANNPPQLMVLMIQKEVAKRICAKPRLRQGFGGQAPKMNLLAASVQFYADAKIIGYVPKEMFWPKPKVDAAILLIKPKSEKPKINPKKFFEMVKAGFSQPRKQLVGNLTKKLKIPREEIVSILKGSNIPEKARAENLSLDDWVRITKKR